MGIYDRDWIQEDGTSGPVWKDRALIAFFSLLGLAWLVWVVGGFRGCSPSYDHGELDPAVEAQYEAVRFQSLLHSDRPEDLRAMLSTNPELLRSPNAFGEPALLVAVQVSAPRVVEILLDHGAKVNARGKDGQTPLHRAVVAGKPKVAAQRPKPRRPALTWRRPGPPIRPPRYRPGIAVRVTARGSRFGGQAGITGTSVGGYCYVHLETKDEVVPSAQRSSSSILGHPPLLLGRPLI